jgi:hypothetical protein
LTVTAIKIQKITQKIDIKILKLAYLAPRQSKGLKRRGFISPIPVAANWGIKEFFFCVSFLYMIAFFPIPSMDDF